MTVNQEHFPLGSLGYVLSMTVRHESKIESNQFKMSLIIQVHTWPCVLVPNKFELMVILQFEYDIADDAGYKGPPPYWLLCYSCFSGDILHRQILLNFDINHLVRGGNALLVITSEDITTGYTAYVGVFSFIIENFSTSKESI